MKQNGIRDFEAKVLKYMDTHPDAGRFEAEKAVEAQEQARLTKGINGGANENNFGSEGQLKEPEEPSDSGENNSGSEGQLNEQKGASNSGLFSMLGTSLVTGITFAFAGARKGGLKGAIAGFTAGAVTGGIAGAVTSCTVEQKVPVTVDDSQTVKLLGEILAEIKGLRSDFNAYRNKQDKTNEDHYAMLDKIVKLLKDGNEMDETQFAEVKSMYEEVIANMTTGNGWLEGIFGKLTGVIDAIHKNTKSVDATKESVDGISKMVSNIVKELMVLIKQNGTQVRQNSEQIKVLLAMLGKLGYMAVVLTDIKGAICDINAKFDSLLAKVDNIITNQEEQAEILADIYTAIQNMDENTQTSLNNILTAILDGIQSGKNSVEDLKALLNLINSSVIDNTEQSKENTKAIIAAIDSFKDTFVKLNFAQQRQLYAIFNAIVANGGKVDDLKALLQTIDNSINNNTAQSKENTAAIIDAIDSFKDTFVKLTSAQQQQLYAIFEAVIANGGKVDDLKALLAKIDNSVNNNTEQGKKNTQAIIDAMKKIGGDVIVAIRQSNAGLSALFDKVIAAINNNTFKDSVNTDAIINAIKKIKIEGGQVDLSSLEAMMRELIALTKQNGNVLTSIDAKMDVAKATLEAILGKIPEAKDYSAQLEAILKAIGNSTYDDSKILASLDKILSVTNANKDLLTKILGVSISGNELLVKILEAIKNHKVDVNVVVECICNHADDGNNEGIIKDIYSLIS